MRKIIIVLFCVLSFTNCKYFRGDQCNNTLSVEGVYENLYDNEAKNILIIKKDGTFEQIFTKGNIIKKNKGTWKFFKKYCEIDFKNLKLLHSVTPTLEKYFTQNGKYRLNKIMFNEDLRKPFDFYKVEN